jgi:flagellar hook-basal body complex protein FliE
MVNLILGALQAAPLLKPTFSPDQTAARGENFASQFLDVLKNAETAAVSGMQGQMPMQDVVMKVMEAERVFATAMAVRDKAVSAYQELSRMQI